MSLIWHDAVKERRLARSQPLTRRQLRRVGVVLIALTATAAVLVLGVQFHWFG